MPSRKDIHPRAWRDDLVGDCYDNTILTIPHWWRHDARIPYAANRSVVACRVKIAILAAVLALGTPAPATALRCVLSFPMGSDEYHGLVEGRIECLGISARRLGEIETRADDAASLVLVRAFAIALPPMPDRSSFS